MKIKSVKLQGSVRVPWKTGPNEPSTVAAFIAEGGVTIQAVPGFLDGSFVAVAKEGCDEVLMIRPEQCTIEASQLVPPKSEFPPGLAITPKRGSR